jgi:hypothetical protein
MKIAVFWVVAPCSLVEVYHFHEIKSNGPQMTRIGSTYPGSVGRAEELQSRTKFRTAKNADRI